MDEQIIAQGHFESGADLSRNGGIIFRVPPCTHWDDDAIRVINRNGEAVVQKELREYSETRSFGTDEWKDVRSLGPAEGIEVEFD